MMRLLINSMLVAWLATAATGYEVISLTPDNYDNLTDGKTVLLKFFAPWCGHCKKMAPDFEKLAEEWHGNAVGLVAEVDCTGQGGPLCEANGVKGFPTLKYGDPSSLDSYEGGRSYQDLAKFASENLKPICSALNIELCDGEKKSQIEAFMAMNVDELENLIEDEEGKIAQAQEHFKDEVSKLNEKYVELSKEKDETIAAVNQGGLGLMKSVKAAKDTDGSAKAKEGVAKDEL